MPPGLKEVDPTKVHRFFYPSVPAVLCAAHNGRVSAMPVTSCIPLSEIPPVVGVSCNPQAFTFLLASRSRLFSLCILDRSRASAIEFLATHSGRVSLDKLADAGLGWVRGASLDVPVIKGSQAVLECSLVSKRRFGDHLLVVGKVEGASASADFKDYWQFKTYHPVLYTGWQGRMTTYTG